MMDVITLQPVSRDNWHACIALKPAKDQCGQLASNLETIAESKFETHYHLRAICADSRVVGMLAFCREVDEPAPHVYWLFRIMIDHREQRKGYARKAIALACHEMGSLGATIIKTMHKPENGAAAKLYASFGFKETGVLEDGDIVLSKNPGSCGPVH